MYIVVNGLTCVIVGVLFRDGLTRTLVIFIYTYTYIHTYI